LLGRRRSSVLHLVGADLLHGLDVGWEDLLREVDRHAGDAHEVPLRCPFLYAAAELRILVEQAPEELGLQHEQAALRERFDACRPRLALQHRPLGEEVALAQVLEILAVSVPLRVDPEPPLLDDVHRAGRIALAHDQLGSCDFDRLERGRDQREPVDGKRLELGMEAEKVLGVSEPRQLLERIPYGRVTARQGEEDSPVEAQRLNGATRAHRCDTRRVAEETHLSEAVAPAERVERDLLAALCLLDDAGRPRDQYVERVCILSLAHDHAPELEEDRLECVDYETTDVVTHCAEAGQLLEDVAAVLALV